MRRHPSRRGSGCFGCNDSRLSSPRKRGPCVCNVVLSGRCKSTPCEVTPYVAEGNCVGQLREREAGWEAAGGERAARRITNPFRRCGAASPRSQDEAWVVTPGRHTDVDERLMTGPTTWLGAGCSAGRTKEAERPCRGVRAGEESEPA